MILCVCVFSCVRGAGVKVFEKKKLYLVQYICMRQNYWIVNFICFYIHRSFHIHPTRPGLGSTNFFIEWIFSDFVVGDINFFEKKQSHKIPFLKVPNAYIESNELDGALRSQLACSIQCKRFICESNTHTHIHARIYCSYDVFFREGITILRVYIIRDNVCVCVYPVDYFGAFAEIKTEK